MYNIFYSNEIHQNQREMGGGERKEKVAVPDIFQLCHDVGPIFPDKSWNRKQKGNLKNSRRTDMEHLEAAGLATFPKSRRFFLFLSLFSFTHFIYDDNPKFIFSFVVVFFVFLVLERRAAAHTETLWWCRITLFYFGEDQNDIWRVFSAVSCLRP